MNKRVIVGLSGGVDSAVTAALLKEQGYDVIGVTMQIWPEISPTEKVREGGCCSLSAVDDARHVANKLGIPYYVLNFKDVFKEKVIDYFIGEYIKGKTPNPCIACNKFVKFDALLKKAISFEADYVATGHYAKIELDENTERYIMKKSDAVAKDQTYALYNLNQEQLQHILMPLGYYTKDKVRLIAKELGLIVANKPESQEICFVDDNNYARFIRENSDYVSRIGNFVDIKGNILGKHKGIIHYTVGQRKGLGVAFGKPMFVAKINVNKNEVVLGENEDVFSEELIAHTLNFIPFENLDKPMRVDVKIRYSAKENPATISPIENGKVHVKFDKPERAITPGQAVVFYDGELLVGGGTIE